MLSLLIDGNSGKGVVIGDFDALGKDKNSDFNIFSILERNVDNLIVQERLVQSNALNELYPNSINTFRTITYIVESQIHVAPVVLRIGSGGGLIDNIHAGGLAVGVDVENECLMKEAYKLGYSDSKLILLSHPDSQIEFHGYKIEGVQQITKAAKLLHGQTPHVKMISWDFTLNQQNKPTLVEANFTGQAVWLAQIVHGKPFFGENTSDILNAIK